MKRILVTGGAGFVGSRLCAALAAREEWSYRAFDLPGPRLEALRAGGETVGGDLLRPGVLEEALRGCDAVVHLVVAHEHAPAEAHERLTVGGAKRVAAAMAASGVRRLVFLSSIKASRDYDGTYGVHKRRAEEVVRGSGLDWTILRPGLLYGPGELRISAIARFLRRWPVFPVPGDGSYPMFPLRTEDLAAAVMAALERPATAGKAYELGADVPLRLDELVDMVAARIGRPRPKVHLPLGLCRILGATVQAFSRSPILFVEQVKAMQAEVRPPDTRAAREDLGFSTPPFAEGLDALVRTWPPSP
jgi:nucleoside-diphosphate-sugar epimerase